MSKAFRLTITHFLLTLERVLLETKSVISLWELDWSAVKYFYNFIHRDYSSLNLNRQKLVNFKANYKKQKEFWQNKESPKELELLASKLREARDRSYVSNSELVTAPVPFSQPTWRDKSPELDVYGDKLSGRYQSTQLDSVWTSDITKVGKRWVFSIMDQTTRQVIAHQLFEKYPLPTDVVNLLCAAMSDRQRPLMFHSDADGIYTSGIVTDFLKSENVVISRGNQNYRKNHNQVQERFHRTLKSYLVRVLYNRMGEASEHTRATAWAFLNQQSLDAAKSLVKEVIDSYNNTFHRGVGASPNMVHSAIAKYGGRVNKLASKGSAIGSKIEEINRKVLTKYAGDWQRFFIEFYIRNLEEHKATQARIRESAYKNERNFQKVIAANEQHYKKVIAVLEREKLGLKSDLESSRKELLGLQLRLEEMEKNLYYISRREASREQEELEERDRKARRQACKRQPKREALFVKEYKQAQKLVLGNDFESCRDRVGLLLLFLTGLRVSRLRLTTGEHLSKLLHFLKEDQQILVYPPTKSAGEISLPLPGEARPLIEERSNDIRRLLLGCAPHDPVMRRTEGSSELLSETNLQKRLNRILKKLSAATDMLFRTHSFRKGLATSVLEMAGVDVAQYVMGQKFKVFDTAASYTRRKYSQKDLTKVLGHCYRGRRGVL